MYFDEENWKMDTDLGKSNDRDWCNYFFYHMYIFVG